MEFLNNSIEQLLDYTEMIFDTLENQLKTRIKDKSDIKAYIKDAYMKTIGEIKVLQDILLATFFPVNTSSLPSYSSNQSSKICLDKITECELAIKKFSNGISAEFNKQTIYFTIQMKGKLDVENHVLTAEVSSPELKTIFQTEETSNKILENLGCRKFDSNLTNFVDNWDGSYKASLITKSSNIFTSQFIKLKVTSLKNSVKKYNGFSHEYEFRMLKNEI